VNGAVVVGRRDRAAAGVDEGSGERLAAGRARAIHRCDPVALRPDVFAVDRDGCGERARFRAGQRRGSVEADRLAGRTGNRPIETTSPLATSMMSDSGSSAAAYRAFACRGIQVPDPPCQRSSPVAASHAASPPSASPRIASPAMLTRCASRVVHRIAPSAAFATSATVVSPPPSS
jgi:hypothetical protein